MKRVAKVLALVGLVLILAEAAMRLAGGSVIGIVPDSRLGWRFLKKHHPRGGASFNSLGVRDAEHPLARPEGKTRVLLLGDSYTAGTHVADNRTFRALTEARLGKTFDVMAGAVSAWSTDQELLYLQEEGLRFQPEVVVLLFAPNDVRENYAKRFFHLSGERLVRNELPKGRLSDRMAWFLLNRSTLFHAYQKKYAPEWDTFRILFRVFPPSFLLVSGVKATDFDLFRRQTPEPLDKAWELSLALVGEIRRQTEESGAKFVLSVIPTKLELNGDLSPEQHEPGKIARGLGQYAAENGIPYLDLYGKLTASPDPLRVYLSHEYHFNDVGHAWVASQLASFLRDELAASRRLTTLPSRH